eukprot:550577-Alexandrium_andersonii.AAC.1
MSPRLPCWQQAPGCRGPLPAKWALLQRFLACLWRRRRRKLAAAPGCRGPRCDVGLSDSRPSAASSSVADRLPQFAGRRSASAACQQIAARSSRSRLLGCQGGGGVAAGPALRGRSG